MKTFLFKISFFFLAVYSCAYDKITISELKTGDIVFAKYTNYFDMGISDYLGTDFSHTLIKTDDGLMSFTVNYVGDKGTVFKDPDLYKEKSRILVLRPVIKNKEPEKVYEKCVNKYFTLLSKKIEQRKIMFDWNLEGKKNTYVCSTFVFHILKTCLPNGESYFASKIPIKFITTNAEIPLFCLKKPLI